MTSPTATVVVVSRDRWSPSLQTLAALLTHTDLRHPVVVVDGAAPRGVAATFDRVARSGRVRVVRRARFLAGNEARNLGADGVRTEWLAFVENDCWFDNGWLDVLVAFGEANDAATVYPAYLEASADGRRVHGLGADIELSGPPGARRFREHMPLLGRRWDEVAAWLQPSPRPQAEPHAFVIRREVLARIGGFDEDLLGWFDHVDLGLHHLRMGFTAWMVPTATCLYDPPPPVHRHDIASFALRWSTEWFERSLRHLCATWDLDPDDPGWSSHRQYRKEVRARVLMRSAHLTRWGERAAAPWERRWQRRWWLQRAAEAGRDQASSRAT